MSDKFVAFDDIAACVKHLLETLEPFPDKIDRLYLVRDLFGKVRISLSDAVEEDESCREPLRRLASSLHEVLGAHGYPAEDAVLFVDADLLADLNDVAQEIHPRVYWIDRLVTGSDWWTVTAARLEGKVTRYTLFSVKGGVGRSTTAAVLAWHLARNGKRVLVVDLDLESPGLSSAMLELDRQPEFGVTDWFVEDLVGQGDQVIEQMMAAPQWAQDFDGDVRVAPAHGRKPGEYLAKLGRVYMDTAAPWTVRLKRLLKRLETDFEPQIVLLESRSGLHDIAAATVTDLDAQVLLFATNSASNWTDYEILFQHWQRRDLARQMRGRLSIVSALTPELDTEQYLQGFRERAWDLFRDCLYDDVASSGDSNDTFSFDLHDEDAPHDPLTIHWTRGLAAGASLCDLERTTVEQAYKRFLERFDVLMEINDYGETS